VLLLLPSSTILQVTDANAEQVHNVQHPPQRLTLCRACCRLCFVLQVMSEVTSFLKMMDEVYTIFGLDYTMALSTRPEGYLGELHCTHIGQMSLHRVFDAATFSHIHTYALKAAAAAAAGLIDDQRTSDRFTHSHHCLV
jgi:hypothetical protein